MIRFCFIIFLQVSIVLSVYSQAAFNTGGSPCKNSEITFNDISSVAVNSRTWDFGDGNTSTEANPVHVYENSGEYEVTLSIQSGTLTDSETKTITIYENPIADFIIDTVVYSSYSRLLIDTMVHASTIDQYLWNFGDDSDPFTSDTNSVLYKYKKAGDYTVRLKLIDENNCVDSISKPVSINDIFRVPNVFTPNGDYANEEFVVTTNGIDLFEIYIYSRWGNLVFKREGHQQIIWDGKLPNGETVKTGVFYYVINVLDSDTQYLPETGFIHVFND